MSNHRLHKVIGECISSIDLPNCEIFMDSECGGPHAVPLFCSTKKSDETEYCEVDILILIHNKIRVIVEIEESGITPIKIFGKFFASAFSSYFIHESKNEDLISMDDSVLFIQIMDKSKLETDSAKISQWKNIEKSILSVIPVRGSKIDNYRLIYGNVNDFNSGNKRNTVVNCVEKFLK